MYGLIDAHLDAKKIRQGTALAFGMLLLMIIGSTLRADQAHASIQSSATIENFCNTETAWGYFDTMYIGNGSANQTLTITSPGQTEVDITFNIETWFCQARAAAIDTKDYTIVVEGTATDIITSKSSNLDHIAPNDPHVADIYGNKLMASSDVNATISVAGWANGSVHRICPKHQVFSYYVPSWDTPVPPVCVNITLVYDFPWAVAGSSQVTIDAGANYANNINNARPGQRINWRHRVINSGVSDSAAISISTSGDGTLKPLTNIGVVAGGTTYSTNSAIYNITQADVGKTICQSLSWTPTSSANAGSSTGANSCVTIPYSYALTTVVGAVPDTADPSTQPNISTLVTNSGPTNSRPTRWEITQVVVGSGYAVPNLAGGDSASDPCGTYFRPAAAAGSCSTIASANNKVFTGSGAQLNGTPLAATTDASISAIGNIGDLEVGTKVCFGLSVRPGSSSNAGWRHSPLECLIIAKKPKVQVWGGDTTVRGDITTSLSTKTVDGLLKTFGSWGQYGVMSSGNNSYMASGSGLSKGATSSAQEFWSKLTFANVVSYGSYNSAANLRAIPAIASRFSTATGATTLSSGTVNNFNSMNDTFYTRTGDLAIKGGTLAQGQSVVIHVTGKVTIDGDIKYTNGTLNSIADIPQLVLIAGSIDITDDVSNVDAWLIASDGSGNETINTCSSVGGSPLATGAALTSTMCDKPLMINGPVVASKLYLRRTAGSGAGVDSDSPAEIINLRPDAYMWAYQRAGGSGRAQTVMTTELAPRF